jgi:hypothetical protein
MDDESCLYPSTVKCAASCAQAALAKAEAALAGAPGGAGSACAFQLGVELLTPRIQARWGGFFLSPYKRWLSVVCCLASLLAGCGAACCLADGCGCLSAPAAKQAMPAGGLAGMWGASVLKQEARAL